jgi:putative NIF3 family GTP cyclohydrolase 1 type 2
MKVKDVLEILDYIAPFRLAADWDNSGFQVGDPNAEVERLALSLDPTLDNLKKAHQLNCPLLVTHHPLIFKPLKRLDAQNPHTATAYWALANGVSIISAHTNWDAIGVAEALADLLELKDRRPIEQCKQNFLKLVVFVPQSHIKAVRDAIFNIGAGTIGDYKECYFQVSGQGGFTVPLDGKPFCGQPGEPHQTEEVRVEVIIPTKLKGSADRAVRSAHPYEEPAFEFYPIETTGPGFGLIANWDPPRLAREYLAKILGPDGRWV